MPTYIITANQNLWHPVQSGRALKGENTTTVSMTFMIQGFNRPMATSIITAVSVTSPYSEEVTWLGKINLFWNVNAGPLSIQCCLDTRVNLPVTLPSVTSWKKQEMMWAGSCTGFIMWIPALNYRSTCFEWEGEHKLWLLPRYMYNGQIRSM